MNTLNTDIVDTIHNLIIKDNKIELCILYGSAASNRLKKSSDIDIAIAHAQGINNELRLETSLKLSAILKREVSVLDLSALNGIILREILKKGITIKNTNTLLKANLIIKMLDYSEDLYPLQKKALLKGAYNFAYEK